MRLYSLLSACLACLAVAGSQACPNNNPPLFPGLVNLNAQAGWDWRGRVAAVWGGMVVVDKL